MLPYTPLQYLLFHEAAGRPAGTAWLAAPQDLVLVMTSANPGGEPLVTGNDEALARLAGIADAFLVHDRDIVARCDDSVLRASAGSRVRRLPVRPPRARLHAARDQARRGRARRCVALGGYFKNTVCVTRGDEAFVSQHIGDLDNAPTCAALDDAVAHLVVDPRRRPAIVAHDLHPDFFSTRHAARLAARWGMPAIGVQHHHAHIAAVVAEHRVTRPVLGLALDGVGLGTDGGAWGGELLRVDGARCERLGHLAPLRLPGGDRAAREPWRMAAAALALARPRRRDRARASPTSRRRRPSRRCSRAAFNAPATSSMGRWFDAAAGLLGVKRRMAFEGQAAMLLEGLAERHGAVAADASLYRDRRRQRARPHAARSRASPTSATPASARRCSTRRSSPRSPTWVARAAQAHGLAHGRLRRRLLPQRDPRARPARRARGARPRACSKRRPVPPNDGGLALGQAWVALAATASGGN